MAWDPLSTLIGIFIGMVLLIIIGWVSWSSRVFVFEACPLDFIACRNINYVNDPGNALADGFTTNEILFVNDSNQLIYHRPPKDLCVPGSNQDIHIRHPQYCSFTNANGATFTGRNHYFGSPFYTSSEPVDGELVEVTTGVDCQPETSTGSTPVYTGVPLQEWDSAN